MSLHHTLVKALRFPFRLPDRLRSIEAAIGRLEERADDTARCLEEVADAVRRVDDVAGGMQKLVRAVQSISAELPTMQGELESLRDGRMPSAEERLDRVEGSTRQLQEELTSLGEARCRSIEERLDSGEERLRSVAREAERLRDRVLPAVVERGNALVDRLAEELEETASLTARLARREPLPAPSAESDEKRLATALSEVQARLLGAFRGDEEEILHRLDRYLEPLRFAGPVLDLGCGRGELLLMLREAGIACTGVEQDDALATEARRRGLHVEVSDALGFLEHSESSAWGAVTAIHLFEHLPPAVLLRALSEIRRVLRPGGLLVAECPNPHNLRVGATLYWLDPTHQHPLLPETLDLFLTASGFEVERREELHPFPATEGLAEDREPCSSQSSSEVVDLQQQLDRLSIRLDGLLHGPRDFCILARRPGESSL